MDFQNYINSRILFSVPIYFRSQEEHKNYFDEKRQKYFASQENFYKKHNLEIPSDHKIRWELDFERMYFHVWKYTEIIGYIEFRKKENSIFAFVWLPEAERYAPLMNRKKFRLARYFPDYEIEIQELTNEEIVEHIYSILDNINNSNRRFRRYYIDKSELNNYVHLIDYHNF